LRTFPAEKYAHVLRAPDLRAHQTLPIIISSRLGLGLLSICVVLILRAEELDCFYWGRCLHTWAKRSGKPLTTKRAESNLFSARGGNIFLRKRTQPSEMRQCTAEQPGCRRSGRQNKTLSCSALAWDCALNIVSAQN
jgi:hypothetical protein